MSAGRVIATATASLAVAGCAVAVIAVAHHGQHDDTAGPRPVATTVAPTSRPAYLPGPSSAATSSPAARVSSRASARRTAPATSIAPPPSSAVSTLAPASTAPPVRAVQTPVATRTSTSVAPAPRTTSHAVVPRTSVRPAVRPATTGQALPLRYSTGNSTRVITVVAPSSSSTVATLQPWVKVSGGWRKQGSAISARVGAAGIGHASEGSTKTPAGSFTLTQAFGRNSDPGTDLPYFRTTPSDYWISTSGRLYNTHQHCAACGYDNGLNERLYYETPYYNYAVVIDYNTRNAPGGVRSGAGSAFFLHVTVDPSTQGCVSIPQNRLVGIMRWLHPGNHPRILIGVA